MAGVQMPSGSTHEWSFGVFSGPVASTSYCRQAQVIFSYYLDIPSMGWQGMGIEGFEINACLERERKIVEGERDVRPSEAQHAATVLQFENLQYPAA